MFLVPAKPWDGQDPLPKPVPSRLECLNWLKKRIQKLNLQSLGPKASRRGVRGASGFLFAPAMKGMRVRELSSLPPPFPQRCGWGEGNDC